MTASALVDTGAILAVLDRDDRWHGACIEAFTQVPVPLLTSEAVLTELFYLVATRLHEVERAWTFVRSGVLTLGSLTDLDLGGRFHPSTGGRDTKPQDLSVSPFPPMSSYESTCTTTMVTSPPAPIQAGFA